VFGVPECPGQPLSPPGQGISHIPYIPEERYIGIGSCGASLSPASARVRVILLGIPRIDAVILRDVRLAQGTSPSILGCLLCHRLIHDIRNARHVAPRSGGVYSTLGTCRAVQSVRLPYDGRKNPLLQHRYIGRLHTWCRNSKEALPTTACTEGTR
jgi:hypothetical protein